MVGIVRFILFYSCYLLVSIANHSVVIHMATMQSFLGSPLQGLLSSSMTIWAEKFLTAHTKDLNGSYNS